MNQPQKVNAKLEMNLVFINHSVCFPDPKIKNTAEAFGLSEEEATKDIVSLGAFRVFPKEVWEEVFGDYKECPLSVLTRIRSQLQRFVDNHTYSYIANAARALPVTKLVSFMETVQGLETKFNEQKEIYVKNLSTLLDHSEKFWLKQGPKIFQTKPDELADLIRSRFDSIDAFRKKFKLEVIPLRIQSLETGTVEVQDLEQAKLIQKARDELVDISGEMLDSKTDQFQVDIVVDLRQRLLDSTQDFLNRVINGKFNASALKALNKSAMNFSELNFMGDEEVSAVIKEQMDAANGFDAADVRKHPEKLIDLKAIAEEWIDTIKAMQKHAPEKVIANFLEGNHTTAVVLESTEGVQQDLTPKSVKMANAPINEDMIRDAIKVMEETQRCATTMFQRRLRIGYTRATNLMDVLEERGFIGPPRGSEPREILIDLTPDTSDPEVAGPDDDEDPF